MELSAVEIFGYCASALIAFSLTRSSVIKLRWYNLFGASSFCAYGIIIGAAPVAVLNGFIVLTNIVFLRRMLLQADTHFSVLPVSTPSNYLSFFFDYHRQEILELFPRFFKKEMLAGRVYFFMMENTEVVGILSGFEKQQDILVVDFDFVIPAYRDCRLGEYVMGQGQQLKKITHYKEIHALADSVEHEKYLAKLGYSPKKNGIWTFDQNIS